MRFPYPFGFCRRRQWYEACVRRPDRSQVDRVDGHDCRWQAGADHRPPETRHCRPRTGRRDQCSRPLCRFARRLCDRRKISPASIRPCRVAARRRDTVSKGVAFDMEYGVQHQSELTRRRSPLAGYSRPPDRRRVHHRQLRSPSVP